MIPSYPKLLEKWEKEYIGSKQQPTGSAQVFRWARGRNLPAQCLALQGTSEASFQKPDTCSWSVFSELRPLAGMQRDDLAALPSPQ